MKNQELIQIISALSYTIDPLLRAKKTKEVTLVTKKMMELLNKLK